jgi:hypothetical protein
MKKVLLTYTNDVLLVWSTIIANLIAFKSIIAGVIAYFIVFILLDAHTYFSKKLDFHNNLFIKN